MDGTWTMVRGAEERQQGLHGLMRMACLFSFAVLPWTAAQAAPSQAGYDPPLRPAGFLSIPQVEGRSYTLAATLLTVYNSNFVQSGNSQDAVRLSPGVEAAIGTQVGRQQLYVGGTLGRDIVLGLSRFNRNRYAIGAGANLRAGTRCTGNLGGQFQRRQLLQSDVVELVDNVQREVVAGVAMNCQGPVGIGFGGTTTYRTLRNDRAQRQIFDSNILTMAPQISYASPALGAFSIGGSFSRVRYPSRFLLTADGVEPDGIDIRSGRIGFSRALGTRLSVTLGASVIDAKPRPDRQLVPGPVVGQIVEVERDGFSGSGFDATLRMQLGARATITASADREARGGGNAGSLLVVSNAYGLDLDYRLTPAITAGIGGTINKQRYVSSFVSPDEPVRRISDDIKRFYGQLSYSPRPRFSVSAEVAHQERQANPAIFSFSNTTGSLTMRVQFGRG